MFRLAPAPVPRSPPSLPTHPPPREIPFFFFFSLLRQTPNTHCQPKTLFRAHARSQTIRSKYAHMHKHSRARSRKRVYLFMPARARARVSHARSRSQNSVTVQRAARRGTAKLRLTVFLSLFLSFSQILLSLLFCSLLFFFSLFLSFFPTG